MGKPTVVRDEAGKPIVTMHQLPDGLWAIDLECKEALKLAKYFLPPTPTVLDRPGKPASRWVYRSRPTIVQ